MVRASAAGVGGIACKGACGYAACDVDGFGEGSALMFEVIYTPSMPMTMPRVAWRKRPWMDCEDHRRANDWLLDRFGAEPAFLVDKDRGVIYSHPAHRPVVDGLTSAVERFAL
jgi:hypothetical protein